MRFRLSSPSDILLKRTVTACDAHLYPYYDAKNRFHEFLGIFSSAIPSITFEMGHIPTCEMLKDRFELLVAEHLASEWTNSAEYVIV